MRPLKGKAISMDLFIFLSLSHTDEDIILLIREEKVFSLFECVPEKLDCY